MSHPLLFTYDSEHKSRVACRVDTGRETESVQSGDASSAASRFNFFASTAAPLSNVRFLSRELTCAAAAETNVQPRDVSEGERSDNESRCGCLFFSSSSSSSDSGVSVPPPGVCLGGSERGVPGGDCPHGDSEKTGKQLVAPDALFSTPCSLLVPFRISFHLT